MILDVISVVLLLAVLVLLILSHKRLVSIDPPQTAPTPQPENTTNFEVVRSEFRAYIQRESSILREADFGRGTKSPYINYESGYPREYRDYDIWLTAWLPHNRREISAVIVIKFSSIYFESHYENIAAQKHRIETAFSFEEIEPRPADANIFHLRVVNRDVDLTQTANWDAAFRWLRENLEKLYWVIRVQNAVGWDNTSFTENSSEDDILF